MACRETSSSAASCSCDKPRDLRSSCNFSPRVMYLSSVCFDAPSIADCGEKRHQSRLASPQPNVAKEIYSAFFLFLLNSAPTSTSTSTRLASISAEPM